MCHTEWFTVYGYRIILRWSLLYETRYAQHSQCACIVIFKNYQITLSSKVQHNFIINIWARMLGYNLLRQCLLSSHSNGAKYHVSPQYILPDILHKIPAIVHQSMWFMHDGALEYFVIRYVPICYISREVEWTRRIQSLASMLPGSLSCGFLLLDISEIFS